MLVSGGRYRGSGLLVRLAQVKAMVVDSQMTPTISDPRAPRE